MVVETWPALYRGRQPSGVYIIQPGLNEVLCPESRAFHREYSKYNAGAESVAEKVALHTTFQKRQKRQESKKCRQEKRQEKHKRCWLDSGSRMSVDVDVPLLRCVEEREATVQLRLICFPHAGGSASSYSAWASLPDIIEVWAVQPPGRGPRAAEPAFGSLVSYAEAVVDALQSLHGPLAFFGHSFGSLVALKAAQTLHSRGLPLPLMLAVSAHGAPGDGLPAVEVGLCALSDAVRRARHPLRPGCRRS